MKKNYIYCILSLIILVLGLILGFLYLFSPVIFSSTNNISLLYSICFVLIGLPAFAVYYKKYHLIKSLDDSSCLAHWTFMPHTSSHLVNTLKDLKYSTLFTLTLIYILALVFICTFIHSYYPTYFLISLIISSCMLILSFSIVNAYFVSLSSSPIHIIFYKDLIYFLDDIYTFKKSIYHLNHITINTSGEPTLLFLYEQLEIEDCAYFTLEIPIPKNELSTADYLRHYYLDKIKLLHQYT